MTDRELLRLHIEAVWGISIPTLDGAGVELTDTTPLPPWSLYQTTLAQGEQITIWRPGVASDERADFLQRARIAGSAFDPAVGMRREIVLRFRDTPTLAAQPSARLLTADDTALLEAFEAGSAAYYLNLACAPCIGVIANGRLVTVAHSSRRTAAACELGINTLPEARHQGYAAAATRAWTHAIQQEALTPIYSAFAHNTASLRLAAAAGYVQVSASVYGPVSETYE
ncbi:MAG TPA: GNAT family N-acetyltransferase [Ktedonobacterales bacterium]|jgi:RimJ/RimL family protein N-acetyltransferase|nr:GNAT family N-acetyltransferase [Ktedonobacterales bacterium]